MISLPAAFNSAAFMLTAIVGDGLILARFFARKDIFKILLFIKNRDFKANHNSKKIFLKTIEIELLNPIIIMNDH
jgi:hypothetical protein